MGRRRFLQMLESSSANNDHSGVAAPKAASLETVMSSFQQLLDTLLRVVSC